jgi:hypothetical protein
MTALPDDRTGDLVAGQICQPHNAEKLASIGAFIGRAYIVAASCLLGELDASKTQGSLRERRDASHLPSCAEDSETSMVSLSKDDNPLDLEKLWPALLLGSGLWV